MVDSRKVKLTLAYDGTRYHGWQIQKNGLTVQEVLEGKLRIMTQEPVRVFGSGRTDAGVHALGQVCHFETHSRLQPETLRKGLNSLLPGDIHVVQTENVHPGFHARYDARSKVYEYRILNRAEPDVFLRRYAWHLTRPLRLEALRQALSRVRGEHDFSSFRSTGSGNRNPVRRVLRAELQEPECGLVHLVFEANGFLRHMVRNLVGTLVDVGTEKISAADFVEILNARDRRLAGAKAPAQGLFLVRVRYGEADGSV
ncbi:MAG: tRNA pseudouridine(38-40) synthase TruA [Deltaproteobacteria bacterium]|nr:tRNA pseudouridine(38-40) synthase TruA [Deltaproteobacteria bacterium]